MFTYVQASMHNVRSFIAYVLQIFTHSVGDPNLSQKLQTHKEDPKELKLEVRRHEGKIKGLNSALKSQKNDLKDISNEELIKSDLERVKLQERNMALAKEFATLKLAFDWTLKMMKLSNLLICETSEHNGAPLSVQREQKDTWENGAKKGLIKGFNAVGADGRGATIKILKSQNLSSLSKSVTGQPACPVLTRYPNHLFAFMLILKFYLFRM
ncbi:hypothetical protein L1987_41851 [Smallanthus sonchifolius]|uniref:Uncharacterized protein n=1 Tax=Smallanthus sonchifolius TaxID=185202 RepID=A0ACB9GVC5_9ASTR|nr:hypothetical protein L1987_41851 [Smallanthus sonchifolius]